MPNFSPKNPSKYLGTNKYITFFVSRNRQPTGADYRQPETGTLYSVGTVWQVSKNPTTGTEGQLYMLSKIVSNVATWSLISNTGIGLESFITNISGPVVPNVLGQVLVDASTTTFTDGSVTSTLKTEVQATNNEIIVGRGANLPVSTIPNGTSSYVLTSNGPGFDPSFQSIPSLGSFNQVVLKTYDASGTYTPTTGMKYCIVEVVGGGGGSGGVVTAGPNTGTASSGGGAGGYAKSVFSNIIIGASQTVTIGSGGTAGANTGTAGGDGGSSSLGSLISATGGKGSPANASPGSIGGQNGGDGGSGTGTMTVNGQKGGPHFIVDSTGIGIFVTSGMGGDSYFAPGGASQSTIAGESFAGIAGQKGSGAGGALCNANSGAKAGAVGGNGFVLITEFISV